MASREKIVCHATSDPTASGSTAPWMNIVCQVTSDLRLSGLAFLTWKDVVCQVTSDPRLSALFWITVGFELRVLQRAAVSLSTGSGPSGLDNLSYLAFLVTMVMVVASRLEEFAPVWDHALTIAICTAALAALTTCLQVLWDLKTGSSPSAWSRTVLIGGATCQIMGTLTLYNDFYKKDTTGT